MNRMMNDELMNDDEQRVKVRVNTFYCTYLHTLPFLQTPNEISIHLFIYKSQIPSVDNLVYELN